MSLSPTQITALRTAIFADVPAKAFLAAGNVIGLRDYLNTESTSIAWRTAVSQDEIMLNGFDWTRVSGLGLGQARVWEWLFSNSDRTINPSKQNVRAGIDTVWSSNPADVAVGAAVYVHCKRAAKHAERMLGASGGTTIVPAQFVFQGDVTTNETAQLIFKDTGDIWTAV